MRELTGPDLSGIAVSDVHAAYEQREIAGWSHQQLIGAATAVISVPKAEPANSFVLHAPLELLARAALLAYLAPDALPRARERIAWLAATYEAAGSPVDAPEPLAVESPAQAAAALVAAIGHGDLAAVDRYAAAFGKVATPSVARRYVLGAAAPSLAAAGHASILFNLLPHGDGRATLLRGPSRELARHPDWQLDWFASSPAAPSQPARPDAVLDALLDVPMLGAPGSDFIYPIMAQVQDGGLAEKLLGAAITSATDFDRAAQHVTRVAAWSMLQEPSTYAPYGWTHCLTMPQAVLAGAGAGLDDRVALAIAATHVAGFRAALGSVALVPDALAPTSPDDAAAGSWREALGGDPVTAAAAVWHANAAEVDDIARELARRASHHHDAHFVKYTLACFEARAADPAYERTYLAAAASLAAFWAALGPDDFFD
jgi:hypothetical protein